MPKRIRTEQQKEASRVRRKIWEQGKAEQLAAYSTAYRYRKPAARLLTVTRRRAAQLGREFNLDASDFGALPTHCPATGIEICYTNSTPQDNSPSVDRINNDLGYIKGNVVIVSWLANRVKSNADVDTLEKVARFYRNLQDERLR